MKTSEFNKKKCMAMMSMKTLEFNKKKCTAMMQLKKGLKCHGWDHMGERGRWAVGAEA
jgi:hypothetical protein